jgi:membrane-bound ClpP family serine protease
VLSIVSFYFVTRKVLEAHRDQPVRGGREELIGASAEVRTPPDPEGQVALGGAIWRARRTGEGAPLRPGDRVTVEAVEGLTLVVRPEEGTT